MKKIDRLIVCSPYRKPDQHWVYDRDRRGHELAPGRRSAGYLVSSGSQGFDDPGKFVEIGLVNEIRKKVDKWRDEGYPGTTCITRRLLNFWRENPDRESPLFFCQMEAIESLIWLIEVSDGQTRIPTDGGPFKRLCSKMATGTGKTVTMAMLIAWQVINRATYEDDARFSKDILVVAPNLTVRSRLNVLNITAEGNYYEAFQIVPDSLREKLLQARIVIRNWHSLAPHKDAPRSVVRLGAEGDREFARRVLEFDAKNVVVINDEAHHAWRPNHERGGAASDETERATVWVEGLDRINRAGGILACFDFSATPFVVAEKKITEETLFGWIVSDFSLNDAIESGLVKTPRLPVRDDSGRFDEQYRSRFYHIYVDPEVKADLNRKCAPEEPLPDLVRNAYYVLGHDWVRTRETWGSATVPPVMITVCNRTETAARVTHSFKTGVFEGLEDLSNTEHMLHIDSRVLRQEAGPSGARKRPDVENIREKANTVGRYGETGGHIRNVISVQMLSEGWDARTVTQIMGLRAFSSQLLCEQVVGRGLRRRSYEINEKTHLLDPEYVSVFGVPFTFLPHEDGGERGKTEKPTTRIEPDPKKAAHEISWPNVDRVETILVPRLDADLDRIDRLVIRSDGISTTVGMAAIIAGKPVSRLQDIDLADLDKKLRMHRLAFIAAKDVYEQISPNWEGSREFLLLQVVRIMERFIDSKMIVVEDISGEETLRWKMSVMFNLQKVARHVFEHIKSKNTQEVRLVFGAKRTKATGEMRPWYTRRQCGPATKSHINFAVYDSSWEAGGGGELERNDEVASWARNAHLGFVIKYTWDGTIHDYWPDYLVRLKNGITLVLEMKGRDDDQNKEKRRALDEWVEAVNEDGRFGTWVCDVAFHPSEVRGIIGRHSKSNITARTSARCPACRKTSSGQQQIQERFGFRNMSGIVRPQSWCRQCRRMHSRDGQDAP